MEQIRNFRKNRGWTQEQLAAAVGVKRSVISKYESGSISPSTDMLRKMADALGVEPWELMDSNVAPELKDFPIDSITRQFMYISDEIKTLTEIDLPDDRLDTHKIVMAVNKIMEVNNAMLRTPRLSIAFGIEEAIIGLKFILCYLNFNWHGYGNDIFVRVIENDLLKNVLIHLLSLYSDQAPQPPSVPSGPQEGKDTTPAPDAPEPPPEGE